jgi:hypothetical protein
MKMVSAGVCEEKWVSCFQSSLSAIGLLAQWQYFGHFPRLQIMRVYLVPSDAELH